MRQQDKQAAMARELLAASAWREGNAAAAHAQKIAERGGTRCSDGSGWGCGSAVRQGATQAAAAAAAPSRERTGHGEAVFCCGFGAAAAPI